MTKAMADTIIVYQWNCRSFNSKRHELSLFIQTEPPDVIALQETNTSTPRLPQYTAFTQDPQYRTAILVHNTHPAQPHYLNQTIPHTFVELIPTRPSSPSVYILNIYSPPSENLKTIDNLIHEAIRKACNNPLLILGDFNAPHPAWGYHFASKKGTALLHAAQNNQLVLQNDLTTPTRIGNSVARDTIPDLTFSKNCLNTTWLCLRETLGSDHDIISTSIPFERKPRRKGTAHLTNWPAFRKDESDLPPIGENLEDWTQALEQQVGKYTQLIALTEDIPAVDPHLMHIWDARRSLTKRWKRQKHNRTLKKRIAILTQKAQDICSPTPNPELARFL